LAGVVVLVAVTVYVNADNDPVHDTVAAPAPPDATVGKVGAAAITATGVLRSVVVLSPTVEKPLLLRPQQFTPPVVNNAQTPLLVGAMDATPDNKLAVEVERTANTCFGVDESVVELIPNCP
jgi:hypothetical protein